MHGHGLLAVGLAYLAVPVVEPQKTGQHSQQHHVHRRELVSSDCQHNGDACQGGVCECTSISTSRRRMHSQRGRQLFGAPAASSGSRSVHTSQQCFCVVRLPPSPPPSPLSPPPSPPPSPLSPPPLHPPSPPSGPTYTFIGRGACLDAQGSHGSYSTSPSVDSSDHTNCQVSCNSDPACTGYDDREPNCLYFFNLAITTSNDDTCCGWSSGRQGCFRKDS